MGTTKLKSGFASFCTVSRKLTYNTKTRVMVRKFIERRNVVEVSKTYNILTIYVSLT